MITVYTRSINDELYNMMRSTIPAEVECVKMTGYNGWEDALRFIKDVIERCPDYAVIVDEDMFFHDWDKVAGIVNHMIENSYTHAGIPDRGVIPHRTLRWETLNPFWNILDCYTLRNKGALNPIDKPSFITVPEFEIFADFYTHLYKIGKPLWLRAATRSDGITTHVMDHLGNFIALHSWYAREWPNGHKERIIGVFNDAKEMRL